MATTVAPPTAPQSRTVGAGKLRWPIVAGIGVGSLALSALIWVLAGSLAPLRTIALAWVFFAIGVVVAATILEGGRQAKDRLATVLVCSAFGLALLPLISVVITTLEFGTKRFDPLFFSSSMRNVIGAGGGAVHAIYGTLWVTGIATALSVPVGLLTAIYLVEYGRGGRLARAITFFVDVMTGIPSIVAGLFAYALFGIIFGSGYQSAISGAAALCVLMIPVVVRSTEEILRLVPNELREASYALGVPKWRTILKVVLPTSLAGLATGVILAIARVIGETAPLLIAMGYTASVNVNPFSGPMMSLPVFTYRSYVAQGSPAEAFIERSWAGALTLILVVMILNLIGRVIAWKFAPKVR